MGQNGLAIKKSDVTGPKWSGHQLYVEYWLNWAKQGSHFVFIFLKWEMGSFAQVQKPNKLINMRNGWKNKTGN